MFGDAKNGAAKPAGQEIKRHKQTPETIALLKMFAFGRRQIDDGNVKPAGDVVSKLRNRNKSGNKSVCLRECD